MEKIPNPTIELYAKYAPDFPGFRDDDFAGDVSRMWNEWYDRCQKETKEYSICRHKAEIVNAANQYEL
jgi:hypothetical protein